MSDRVRCKPCLGLGYKGTWRRGAKGRVWKIGTCRSCGGRGERPETDRQRARRARKERP